MRARGLQIGFGSRPNCPPHATAPLGSACGTPPCVVWLHERPAVARSLDAHGFGQLGDGNTFKRQDGVVNAPCPGVRDCELGCSEELFGNALTVERPRAGPVIDWDISIVSATIRGN